MKSSKGVKKTSVTREESSDDDSAMFLGMINASDPSGEICEDGINTQTNTDDDHIKTQSKLKTISPDGMPSSALMEVLFHIS